MTTTQKQNGPDLRFTEFDGKWEEKYLGDGVDLISGQHLSPNEYSKVLGECPYFTGPSDFTNDSEKLTKWTIANSKNAYIGDVLVTAKGSGVGELWYLGLPKVAIGRQLMAIRGRSSRSDLIFHFLSTQRNYLTALAAGNMIPGLSRTDLLKIKIGLPTNPNEQQKIALLLSSVDTKIEQTAKKKALLEKYKKGMMQKLFSQTLRFPSTPPRASQAGGEVDKQHQVAERSRSYPYYGASGIIDYIDEYLFDGEYILLGEDGANIIMRNSRLSFLVKGKFWVNNHAHVIQAKGSNSFLAEVLESIRYDKYNTGTAQPKLNANVCKKIWLQIPPLEEQQKIANFLSALDKKIDFIATELKQAQSFKKALLQQMFV